MAGEDIDQLMYVVYKASKHHLLAQQACTLVDAGGTSAGAVPLRLFVSRGMHPNTPTVPEAMEPLSLSRQFRGWRRLQWWFFGIGKESDLIATSLSCSNAVPV